MNTLTNHDLFEGLMLSDGHLELPRACSFPRYSQTCKETEFLEWVASILPVPSKIYGPYLHTSPSSSKLYEGFVLKTNTDEWFAEYHERWYRKKTKYIPEDFKVTSASMLTAYMGDGCLHDRQRVSLAMNCFSRESIDRLLVLPLRQHGMHHWRVDKRNVIYSDAETTPKFIAFTGPCPVGSLNYKWDLKSIRNPRLQRSKILRSFSFISPEGTPYTTDNLRSFCREMQLERKYMSRVFWGDQKHHKGWTKGK